jgi:hydroxymethylpyrimidine/phosphomethylpyrimidine kinase
VRSVALTIAGSDPSGGAGIQADLKVFHRFGVYGEAVITLLTVQNSMGVSRVEVMPPDLVVEQIEAVVSDIPPAAAKAGALGSIGVVRAVAQCAAAFAFPLVVDPVMLSKQGAALLDSEALGIFRRDLLPRAYLLTPNLEEAARLTGREVDTLAAMRDAARALCDLGAHAVLVKGGHLPGDPVDVLCDGRALYEFPASRLNTRHTHGTGCTYSAAITAGLAGGLDLVAAIQQAKDFNHWA